MYIMKLFDATKRKGSNFPFWINVSQEKEECFVWLPLNAPSQTLPFSLHIMGFYQVLAFDPKVITPMAPPHHHDLFIAASWASDVAAAAERVQKGPVIFTADGGCVWWAGPTRDCSLRIGVYF